MLDYPRILLSVAAPTARGLQAVDWAIVFLYAVSTITLGWWIGRRQKDPKEYFVGSGNMNPLLIGVSLFATLLSTISYLALPGESIGKGPIYLTNLVAYPFIFLIVGYVLLPVYMRQRVTSAYELLEMRLGLSLRLLGAFLFLLLRLFWMSLLVFLTAEAIVIMIGVDESHIPLIVLITGTIAITYTDFGRSAGGRNYGLDADHTALRWSGLGNRNGHNPNGRVRMDSAELAGRHLGSAAILQRRPVDTGHSRWQYPLRTHVVYLHFRR